MEGKLKFSKLSRNLISYILINFFTFNELIQCSKINSRIAIIIKNNKLFRQYIQFIFKSYSLNEEYLICKDIFYEKNISIILFNCFNYTFKDDINIQKQCDEYNVIPLKLIENFLNSFYNKNELILYNHNELQGHFSCIWSLCELKNGMILSSSDDNTLRIWDPKNNFNCYKVILGHTQCIYYVSELSNNLIVSVSMDMSIRIWDPSKGYECVRVLRVHTSAVTCLCEINKGNFSTGSWDKTISIWNINLNKNENNFT